MYRIAIVGRPWWSPSMHGDDRNVGGHKTRPDIVDFQ